MEQNYDLENKVLNKAFKKVLEMGKQFTTEEGMKKLDNNYWTALKVARINTILQVRELIDSIQELEGIADVGVLESMVNDNLKEETELRIDTHSNIVNLNNQVAEVFSQLIKDLLGEDELQSISVSIQLDNIM